MSFHREKGNNMPKINPINNIKSSSLKNLKYLANSKIDTTKLTAPFSPKLVPTLATSGVLISTFIKDYKKTADEDNYFQFKTNPQTGKHYEADVFQNAAAMNLYLGNDVLVTAPTGTGKTAIAEYIITKNLKEGKKTYYTAPLKALSNQKFREFSEIYGEENVGIITGDTKIRTDAPIILMTTEVFRNMAMNEAFNSSDNTNKGLPQDLQTVIFDELHYLDDVDRGGIWEQSIMFTPENVQILSLSATIGNNNEINNWIASTKGRKANGVTPDKTYIPINKNEKETVLINVPPENRHVPLVKEIIRVTADIKIPRGGSKKQKANAKREAVKKTQTLLAKPNDMSYKEITRKLNEAKQLPAIYFVYNKKDSKHLLKFLSTESELLTTEEERNEIARIIKEEYLDKGIYLGEGLNTTALLKGYATHNAGMLPNQKKLIEELFQKKLVKIAIATTTLSAGINMPAKTVVISSPIVAGKPKTPNEEAQEHGRAGRRGIDTIGYVYMMSCNSEQAKLYQELTESKPNDLKSRLELDYSTVANYIANSFDESILKNLLSKSYYAFDNKKSVNEEKLEELINAYNVKKEILNSEGYIKNTGELSTKGKMIKHLNGYEQIPIINILADRTLEFLNPVQIAGVLGGLANIEYETKTEFPHKPFEVRRQDDAKFVTAANKVANAVDKYAKATEKLHPEKEIFADAKVMDHIYTWALLNAKNEDSLENWKTIYENNIKNSGTDEGGLHKEIVMTIDLIKQLIGVCEVGATASEKHHDYYLDLADKLHEALNLIQKEPADERI